MGRPYLIFGVAAILAFLSLASLHLRYKPVALEWAFYDPTFFYVLKETPEALARASCESNTVMAFGSSPLDTALARRGDDWRRRAEWRRYDGPLDDSQRVFSIVRTLQADLRMFYPVLALLPDCRKIVVLTAGLLLQENLLDEGAWEYWRTLLIDSPTLYYGALLERFWAPAYRLKFSEGIGPIIRAKKPFNRKRFEPFYRERAELREILPAHRDIILELVKNKAQVVILDVDRSGEWENAGVAEQQNFRRILRAFADSDESIHYRHFSYIDAQYYLDFAHMNYKGADIFRPWLAAETAEIARAANEF